MPVIYEALQDVVDVLNGAGIRAAHYTNNYVPPIALVFPSDPWLVDADSYTQTAMAITVRVYASTANLETAVEELSDTIELAVKTFNSTLMGIASVVVEAPSIQPVGTGSFLCTDINLAVWVTIP